jgi:hypothetical protein
MARTYKPKANLSKLKYSPQGNPIIGGAKEVKTRQGYTRFCGETGLLAVSVNNGIHQVEELNEADFLKPYLAKVETGYDLTKTAVRVLGVALRQYQKRMSVAPPCESVNMRWSENGIEGIDAGMSRDAFNRGLRELIDKKVLYPKDPESFWINPHLFFSGESYFIVHEYRNKKV